MNFQEPDPIREYLINEMLKNIIYIGLVREKDNIEKKLAGNLNSKKKALLEKELTLLTEEINILKSNKNAKYNEVIYKRFYSNLSRIKKIINDNKKNFEDLINTYVALIDSNDVNKNPALLTKQLQHIRDKLRTYINIIPTNDNPDNERQSMESYKQSLLELENKIDLLNSQMSAVSEEELEIYNNELYRINENIKSNNDEELKLQVGKLKIKIAELKNKETSNSDLDSESSDSDSSDSASSSNSLSDLEDFKKTMTDDKERMQRQLKTQLETSKEATKEHNNELKELQDNARAQKQIDAQLYDEKISDLKSDKKNLEKKIEELVKKQNEPNSKDEKLEKKIEELETELERKNLKLDQEIRRGREYDDIKRRDMNQDIGFMDSNESNFGGRLTKKEKRMYKEVFKMFGGNDDKENEKTFSFDKSFYKENEEREREEKDKEEKEEKEKVEDREKENEKKEKDEREEKKEKKEKEIKDAKLKDKNKKEYPVNIKYNNELNNYRAILITELHNIMTNATKHSKNIYKWYIDDKGKSLIYKLKELKQLTEKLDNNKITKPKNVAKLQDIFYEKISNIDEMEKIISNQIINSNDSIFNDNDGLLVSINGIEDSFELYKKIIRDDTRKALEIFFKKNNAERVNTTQYIDKLLELLNKKFKNLLSSIYDGIRDLYDNLKEYKNEIEKIKLELEREYSTLSKSDDYNNNMGMMGQMGDYFRRGNQWGGDEEDEDEDEMGNARRKYEEEEKKLKQLKEEREKKKNELLNKYYNKFNDINIAKYENSLKILDILNNNEIYDDYKYEIYGKLYSKLVDTEKMISLDKKESNQELSAITEEGNIITNTGEKIENIFSILWNRYNKAKKNNNNINDEAEDNFYNAVKTNDLNPDKILELSLNDKVIFIVLIFVIRQISLFITETLINSNNLKSLFSIICCYLGVYIGLLVIMTMWVNMDNYKMRILFNFLNFHINSYGVYNHLFMLILFTLIIYYYIYSTDKNVREDKYENLSELEKIEIKYKLDIITLIIYIFTSLVDYLI